MTRKACEVVPVKHQSAEISTYHPYSFGCAEHKILHPDHLMRARADHDLVHETAIRNPRNRQASAVLSRSIQMETKRGSNAATIEATHGARLKSRARAHTRATPVKSACIQCRRRKTRCSGQRPTCQRCLSRGARCLWDVCDGLSKDSDFRRKLQELVSQLSVLETLVDKLRSGTDHTATLLLAKLRLGVTTEDLVRLAHMDSCEQYHDAMATSRVYPFYGRLHMVCPKLHFHQPDLIPPLDLTLISKSARPMAPFGQINKSIPVSVCRNSEKRR